MAVSLILNGTFDARGANWTGTDLEFNPSNANILGTGSNIVSKIEGRIGRTTVLQQLFNVTAPITTELKFDVALRTAALNDAHNDAFDVEILDSTGTVVASLQVCPTVNGFQQLSLTVNFPTADVYTLRFAEVGDNDSLGTVIDNVAIMVCFAGCTQIKTPRCQVSVAELRVGDVIDTMNGPKTLRWIGRRHVSRAELAAEPRLAPICISAGALGSGLPQSDLLVSRQHRLLAQSSVAERMFGARNVLL
ncbi:MAG: hypothetical protein ACJAVT_002392 [Yoonia sp.]|jgi:hypothetical protein